MTRTSSTFRCYDDDVCFDQRA